MSLALAAGEYSASTDLKVTKDDTPDPVNAGENITYTITVTNDGPGDASGVTLQDILPAGVIFVSSAPTQGSCSEDSGTVSCDLGTLALDGSLTVDIVVTAPSVAGSISNEVAVSGDETDPDNSNNSAIIDTLVLLALPNTDLAVGKNDTPDPVNAGENITYTVTVTNNGPSDATGLVLTDTLPAGGNSYTSAATVTGSRATIIKRCRCSNAFIVLSRLFPVLPFPTQMQPANPASPYFPAGARDRRWLNSWRPGK